MLRRALLPLTPELFPDVDPRHPPQTVEDWIRHYAQGDRGAVRLSQLLRKLSAQGYEQAQRRRLHLHFAHTTPVITQDQLDKFLYRQRLGVEGRILMVRYLWEEGVLPDCAHHSALTAEDLVVQLHHSLANFWNISQEKVGESAQRLVGQYWIFRASIHDPAHYVRGLLQVRSSGGALQVLERYRVLRNVDAGEYGLEREYGGLILEKAERPVMISSLRAEGEVTCLRLTTISEIRTHGDGRIISMRGVTTSSYRCGRVVVLPVCFERIAEDDPRNPDDELCSMPESEVPPTILSRLGRVIS